MQVACYWEVEAGKDLEGLCATSGRRRVWAGDGEVSGTVQVMDGRVDWMPRSLGALGAKPGAETERQG